MDPQHPNHRGERGLRALTSSPVVPAPPSRHRRPAVLGTPALTATRITIGSCCEPGQAIWDGADAAQALGIAPGTVKSRTYYALRALRLAIEELRDVE
ncbi:MAG: hypothetical protein QOJ73_6580 [Streptosporangiaceae bacterium]|nr:hypothetical protein [Streptosporangiaceae bacterium]